jgi:hypothetical protein
MSVRVCRTVACSAALALLVWSGSVAAHAGPPYPMVSERRVGPYHMAVWTDPDTTDDGSAGGQFWVTLASPDGRAIPRETRVTVSIHPPTNPSQQLTAVAADDGAAASRYFAALVMDHEGPFNVGVNVNGPMGEASVDGEVQATYDARPSGLAVVLTVLPFLLAGGLWAKVLLRRKAGGPERTPEGPPTPW